jgi:ABC-type nitrate/sulfonate/bicarbonate transport system permease component
VNKLKKLTPGWGILPIVIFLAVWEIVARLNLVPGHFAFPPFSVVVMEFYHLTANGVLGDNFLASLVRVLIGFCAGSIAGVAVGVVMGWRGGINKALNPIKIISKQQEHWVHLMLGFWLQWLCLWPYLIFSRV